MIKGIGRHNLWTTSPIYLQPNVPDAIESSREQSVVADLEGEETGITQPYIW